MFSRVRFFSLTTFIIMMAIGLTPTGSTFEMYVSGELVVGLSAEGSIDSVNAKFGTIDVQCLPLLNVFQVNSTGGVDLDYLAGQIATYEGVSFCHPNYLIDPLEPVQGSIPFGDITPDGDLYDNQGAAAMLHLDDAHDYATGSEVTVAVIDGGINLDHPALADFVGSGWDYVDNDATADDEEGGENSGHGTFVAGVVHMVAPEAQIRSYRVTNLQGESNGYIVAEAILQAVTDGCNVINLSLVTMEEHLAIASAIDYARDNNVMVVTAAGNSASAEAHYPASDVNSVAVAAVDSTFLLADFSSFGDYIDVCAPGVRIFAPYLDTSYAWWTGTSFAAPFVAAEAALLFSLNHEASWQNVYDAIMNSAVPIDSLNPGYDGQLGAGLIDPLASLMALLGGASVLHVPADYPTIDEAIDAAYHGDTILVAPGTYYGMLNFDGKSIKLHSEQGPEVTILRPIDYTSSSRILYMWGTYLPGVEIVGFTITGHRGTYPAVEISGASPLISNCIFHSNNLLENDNDPIINMNNGAVTVERCVFYNNGSRCIQLQSETEGSQIINNTFDGNEIGVYTWGGGVFATFRNNIIVNSSGMGASIHGDDDFDWCDVWNNDPNYYWPSYAGDNDISEDPLFVDAEHHDYRLLPSSPCIDAGDPDPMYNDPDGSRADIGAIPYETIVTPLALGVTFEPSIAGNVVTSLTPTISWVYYEPDGYGQMYYEIQVGTDDDWSSAEMWASGSVSSSGTSAVYGGATLSDLTEYHLRLRVNDGSGWGDYTYCQFTTSVATTINVPGDVATIQEAVDAASEGDTVFVAPGTYYENISINDKNVALISVSGPEVTIIESANAPGTVLLFGGGQDSTSVVSGFTIQNGAYGLASAEAGPVLTGNRFLNNTLFGVLYQYGRGAVVYDNYFEGNNAAFEARWAQNVRYEKNTVVNNSRTTGWGGMVCMYHCDTSIVRDNIVVRNSGDRAIYVYYGAYGSVHGNTIYGNDDGGIYVRENKNGDVRNNIVAFNTGTYGLVGSQPDNDTTVFEYNDLYGNRPADVWDITPGAGTIFADPLFADTTGSDFELLPGSPCIDAGDPDPQYSDPDGSRCDMGAVPCDNYVYPVASSLTVSPLGQMGYASSLTPTISWIYLDTAATSQVQYHLQVGTDQEWTTAEMWDNGPVTSVESSIEYSGTPLQDFHKYYFRVRVNSGSAWGDWFNGSFMPKVGQVLHVPEDVATIQRCIELTFDGDTVLVGPGTYNESIDYIGKKIVVKSSDGPLSTIIEPSGLRAVTFSGDYMDTTAVLEGFTINNGGIEIDYHSAGKAIGNRILNSGLAFYCSWWTSVGVFRDNFVDSTAGGIHLEDGQFFVEGNVILRARSAMTGNTICLYRTHNTVINRNVIANCEIGYDNVAVIMLFHGDSNVVTNNTIVGNHIAGSGGSAIELHQTEYATILNNVVAYNDNLIGIHDRYGDVSPSSAICQYNDVYQNGGGDYVGVEPGMGAIAVDPLFADTASFDYSLSGGSPCIDAGHPGLQYMDPDGSINDMGAIPYDGPVNLPVAQNITTLEGDLSHVVGRTPTFCWTFYDTLGTASGYQLEVGTDNDWTSAEQWATGQVLTSDTSATYDGEPLGQGSVYYLRLRVYNGSTWGDWRTGAFIMNTQPTSPQVVGPADGDDVSLSPVLGVTRCTDADGDYLTYRFEVYSDPSLTSLIAAKDTFSLAQDTIWGRVTGDFGHDTEYWWRAAAYDGYEFSGWTSPRSFIAFATISLDRLVGGDADAGVIDCGRTVDYLFRLSNSFNSNVYGMSNAMEIYSPDGAEITLVDAYWDDSWGNWSDEFDLYHGVGVLDGASIDTLTFGSVVMVADGFAVGDSRPAWRVKLSVDCNDEGKTLCIDSLEYMPWLWQWTLGANGSPTARPDWDGPHCFTIERCCFGMRGDINDDGNDADIGDLTYLVDYYFHGGDEPHCAREANVNGDPDEQLDISDLTYLVEYMFVDGAAPCDCDIAVPAYAAKSSETNAAGVLTAYASDTTYVSCEANFDVRGAQLILRGRTAGEPVLTAAEGLEMPFGFEDSTLLVGILDLDGPNIIGNGQQQLLKIPGRFEVIEARLADEKHRTVVPTLGTGGVIDNVPDNFELSQNYPNPFNPATRINFGLPVSSNVRLEIFNILGQKVITLRDGHMPAGRYSVIWNGTSKQGKPVSSGVYFYRLETEQFTESKKMMLLK